MLGAMENSKKNKEFEREFGDDFKMLLGSMFDGFWIDLGAKLQATWVEIRITN
jgi:hypothetical protein